MGLIFRYEKFLCTSNKMKHSLPQKVLQSEAISSLLKKKKITKQRDIRYDDREKEGETVNKWRNALEMTRGGRYSFGSDHLPRSLTATPLVGSQLPSRTGQSPVDIWVECAG